MCVVWEYDESKINWADLAELYRLAPLGNKSARELEQVFSNSRFKCFAFAEHKIVAAGRALADGVDCSYLCDIAVHPDFQGKGLGKTVVKKLVDFSSGHKKIILYANPGKEGFYRHLGFYTMNTAMAIFKNHNQALSSGVIAENKDQ